MVLVALTLVLALLACFCMYPQAWRDLARPLFQWRAAPGEAQTTTDGTTDGGRETSADGGAPQTAASAREGHAKDRIAMPPPPSPAAPMPTFSVTEHSGDGDDDEEATTPKAQPARAAGSTSAVPSFSLSAPSADDAGSGSDSDDATNRPPPTFPSPFSAQRAGASADPSRIRAAPTAPARAAPSPGLMRPPPRPSPLPRRTPNSTSLPIPNRGPPAVSFAPSPSSSSSLALPPSTTARPRTPANARNKVVLTPGHSPLDWARLAADPAGNNLRGAAGGLGHALLRVTPAQLKTMNGRRGRDAWTALGGMVYNITPYVPYHPGGAGELLRCAGRDGTRLFNEVHAWVNYDNMLGACRVGILVEEADARPSPMEEMD